MAEQGGNPASGIPEAAVTAEHEHWFHALWAHLGPHGRQDIHYHPCAGEDEPWSCAAILVGYGRACGGSAQRHVRSGLPLPDDLAVPGEPEADRVPANPVGGIPEAESAWQAWYEPEQNFARAMAASTYDEMHRAFLAAFELGAAAEREKIIKLASAMRASIPADHPKGAQASFADYLRVTSAAALEATDG
jgi:hypothetical protein